MFPKTRYTSPYAEKERTDYRRFMRRVGSLLQRDANLTMTSSEREERLDTFVNDTYSIEYNIASIAGDYWWYFDEPQQVMVPRDMLTNIYLSHV